jgi:endonuclease/exonuclease/phosphatase family metal-dependent hydrolase
MRIPVLIFLLLCLLPIGQLSAGGQQIRVATFNIAMGFEEAGEMTAALESGDHHRLVKVAEILQHVRPDIVLLNEFDYDPDSDAASLLNKNFLSVSRNGLEPLRYDYHYRGPVNTGIDSGMDLDGDGNLGGPGDAWGFGHFPGQYGMLVLSRFPLVPGKTRTFQNFRWADLPMANRPGGDPFDSIETWKMLRLSSKSHWDLVFDVGGTELHLLTHHPTPPVFDGPEDRNGLRNFDEIRFWRLYYQAGKPGHTGSTAWITDDEGRSGGLDWDARFVIAGDFNADPLDGDSIPRAIQQPLSDDRINSSCEPASRGGQEAASRQGGINDRHRGHPALDTADFNDEFTGNLRLDYLLPSANIEIKGCGVFWPAEGESGHDLVDVSDHRLVWMDIEL